MKKSFFIKSIFNKLICFVLVCALFPTGNISVFALTDTKVFTDPVENIYVGRNEGTDFIENLSFDDVGAGHWAKEAVTRSGAYDMVKGYNGNFEPNGTVSNQEALAFVLRVMGMENAAQTRAAELKEITPQYNSVVPTWANGYLSLAQENGLISELEYLDTLVEDQSTLDPRTSFF